MFPRYKTDKQGNKRKNKVQYIPQYGEYWYRVINPPTEELKILQKRINKYIVKNIALPSYAFGGVKERDNIKNARVHKGQKYVFQTDLKDFFPNITNKMVYSMFVNKGFSPDVASLLTKLTTFQGHLPQGSPTSTTIANLVFESTGRQIEHVAERNGLRFTTFVDDITLSSQHDFHNVIETIIDILCQNGYKISHNKTSYRSGITEITGVKMLNNAMSATDIIHKKINETQNSDSLSYRGLKNYAVRIQKISRKKI